MRLKAGLAWVWLAILPACEPENLYIAHQTVPGVNASVNEGRQQGQLVIGYDRDFATVIPKTVKIDKAITGWPGSKKTLLPEDAPRPELATPTRPS